MILNRLINTTFSIYDSKFLSAQRKRKKPQDLMQFLVWSIQISKKKFRYSITFSEFNDWSTWFY